MLKKISISKISLNKIQSKIEIRDIVYDSLDSVLSINSKKYIKFIDLKDNIIILKVKNSNVSQEILLTKNILIKKIIKKYKENNIIDINIKVGSF